MYTTTIFGLDWECRDGTNDEGIIRESFTHRLYSFGRFNTEKIFTIVDIGGHVGSFAVHACMECPNAIIWTYEPIPENYILLSKHVLKHDRIFESNKAVYGKKKPIAIRNFMPVAGDGLVNTGATDFVYGDGYSCVDSISIEEIQKEVRSIDVLKLDCEGGEESILESIDLSRVGIIMIEFHVEIFKPVYSQEVCFNLKKKILDAGFRIEWSQSYDSNMPLAVFVNDKYCVEKGLLK